MDDKEFNQERDEEFICGTPFIWAEERREKRKKRIYIFSIIASFILGASLTSIFVSITKYHNMKNFYQKVATVKSVLDNEFLYEYSEEEIADYAALGMTFGLSDPYTNYYPKNDFTAFKDDGNGDFVGIGIVVVANTENNTIEIESVTAGSPAEKAGVLPGDILTGVDGESYTALEFSQAVSKVRGADMEDGSEGKEVKLTVIRNGEEKEFTIVREKIHTDSVESKMLDGDIGYIHILGFNSSDGENADTTEEFKSHLEKLKESGAKKLILDVRDNGGGDLFVVSDIIDMIVPKGVIVYSENKKGERDYIYSDQNELNMPMAVLVNGNTASAAELFTGALKDYDKATVVGTKTYGKGVVQRVYPFEDGSGIVVTVARYYTPNGTCVQDEGITPDVVIEEEEQQLQKAIEILKEAK